MAETKTRQRSILSDLSWVRVTQQAVYEGPLSRPGETALRGAREGTLFLHLSRSDEYNQQVAELQPYLDAINAKLHKVHNNPWLYAGKGTHPIQVGSRDSDFRGWGSVEVPGKLDLDAMLGDIFNNEDAAILKQYIEGIQQALGGVDITRDREVKDIHQTQYRIDGSIGRFKLSYRWVTLTLDQKRAVDPVLFKHAVRDGKLSCHYINTIELVFPTYLVIGSIPEVAILSTPIRREKTIEEIARTSSSVETKGIAEKLIDTGSYDYMLKRVAAQPMVTLENVNGNHGERYQVFADSGRVGPDNVVDYVIAVEEAVRRLHKGCQTLVSEHLSGLDRALGFGRDLEA